MNADKHKDDICLFQYPDVNGNIPLVLNDDANLFATSAVDNRVYYGISKFEISKEQTTSTE